jgi:simple sugar transport system ATP-binding protein
MPDELVRMDRINKFFGRVQALNDVTLSVNRSEIVGLLGDNGAGKSTLIKILSGALQADSGDIYMRGNRVKIRNTTDAMALGIETIYQDSALISQLSIARNQVARTLLKQVGIKKDIPPTTPISALSGGERQAVAIARAMHFESELIILDEPTNNLGVEETQGVLRFVRGARDSGHSCILIAHNIYHVFQVVDRIIVLRRGKTVADDIDPKRTTIEAVEGIITGMPISASQ